MQSIYFNGILILSFVVTTFGAPTDPVESSDLGENDLQSIVSHDSQGGQGNKIEDNNFYEYRHIVADGVQKALDECREKFKWDRWNCPKKAFLDILRRVPTPANKEIGLTRALTAASVVLSLTRSCNFGAQDVCGCSQPNHPKSLTKFNWRGCEATFKYGFKVSKNYLEYQDTKHEKASRLIGRHNYEAGRHAVRKLMKKTCKCHGVSGSCQLRTCWRELPDLGKVADYLKRHYRLAAKVGTESGEETDFEGLGKELSAMTKEKLVFNSWSPDYCYENVQSGVNGTLGRYCSRSKHKPDGTEVSREEKGSCDRLCTKCGYNIKREKVYTEKQCNCRFVYCCTVECQKCPHVEETFRCVRYGQT